MSQEPETRSGKDYTLLSKAEPVEKKEPEAPTLFGGLDFAKRVDRSALEMLNLKKDSLSEYRAKIWDHVNYAQVSLDVHDYHAKHPMMQIGFDRNGVGDAAIELFDTITLPMVPILSTNTRIIDMFNSIETLVQTGQLKLSRKSPIREQWENQPRRIDPRTGNVSYPHGSVDNDLLRALCFGVYVALPFMVSVDVPMVIKRGTDQLNHYENYSPDQYLAAALGYENYSQFGNVSIHKNVAQRLFRK